MESKLEKILNPWFLLALNIIILIMTEMSGRVFQEKGIIHLVAVLFVILGISRIFVHYDAYDHFLRPLIHGGSAVLLIFSASHLVEFLGYIYFHIYEDAIFINVVNFYIMSMFVIAVGAEFFLRALSRSKMIMIGVLSGGAVALFLWTILIFSKKVIVSLEPDEALIYGYSVLVLLTFFFSLNRLIKIKRHVSIMAGFVDYFIAAFVLITISALQYVFYDLIESVGVPDFQIVYVSHFLFYGALSFMFLAFARLANLGGVYQEAQVYEKNHIKK